MGVVLGDAQDFAHVFAVGVWELAARLRTHLVDRAQIGLEVEERAGRGLQDPVAFFIAAQVAGGEIAHLQTQVLGDANDVTFFKDGARCFAAIGAGQAIDLVECGIVAGVELFIEVLGRIPFPRSKEALNGLAVAGRPEQLTFVRVLQWGSWNAGLDVKVVSVKVCKNAMSWACWTGLNWSPPEEYFMKASMVSEGTPPLL